MLGVVDNQDDFGDANPVEDLEDFGGVYMDDEDPVPMVNVPAAAPPLRRSSRSRRRPVRYGFDDENQGPKLRQSTRIRRKPVLFVPG